MFELDAQISIVSYAVISAKFETNNKIVYSFLPLVEHALIVCADRVISIKDLIKLFKEIYGYAIPVAILDTLLRKLKQENKIEFLKNEKIEILSDKLVDYNSEYELKIRSLISDFSIFENKNGKTIKETQIVNLFLEFLLHNAVEFNSFIRYQSNMDTLYNDEKDTSADIVSFLLEERRNNTKNYEFLQDVFYGITLSTILASENDANKLEGDLLIESLLLDSNFIFRLLDLQTEFENIASMETYDLLKEFNCKFYVLPSTLKQIADTLTNAISKSSSTVNHVLSFYGDDRFSGLNSACIRRDLTQTKLTEIISSLEEDLKRKFNVTIISYDEESQLTYSTNDFESLAQEKPDSSDSGIIHDLHMVDYIRSRRSANVYVRQQAKHWVLTDDNKLTRWNTVSKKGSDVPECITESQLVTVLWLQNPKLKLGDSLFNTALALRNRSLISNKEFELISKTIERQVQRYREDPVVLKKLPLVFTDNLVGLSEMACGEIELVDARFDEALKNEESAIVDAQRLKEANDLLKAEKELSEEEYSEAISERENRIVEKSSLLNHEELEHINTLQKLRTEKHKQLLALQQTENDYKQKLKTIRCASSFLIFIPAVIIAVFIIILGIYSKLEQWFRNNQLVFWILSVFFASSFFCGLIQKAREKVADILYALMCKKKEIVMDDYRNMVDECQKEIEEIQSQIEARTK